ncbi:MAG: hypothetical protein ACREJ2_08455, partial [Planctomycetota bacterium]
TRDARYPYQFQAQAQVSRNAVPVPARPANVVVNTAPIQHRVVSGQGAMKGQVRPDNRALIKLLTSRKSVRQLIQAKILFDPPMALNEHSGF